MHPEGNFAHRRRIELTLLHNEVFSAHALVADPARLRNLLLVRLGIIQNSVSCCSRHCTRPMHRSTVSA